MVGDTDYDVIGAKAHGIDTIGVTWGYGQRESMQQAGAVALADTPDPPLRKNDRAQKPVDPPALCPRLSAWLHLHLPGDL